MADIFDKCIRFHRSQRLVPKEDYDLAKRILFDTSPVGNAGPTMCRDGRTLLQFSTNDYLGMSNNRDVRDIAVSMVQQYGIGAPMGARPLTGTTVLHMQLEQNTAAFKGTEAALTFSAGANAMMGVVSALAGPSDLVLLDQHAHTSLLCGARISYAESKRFRHNDVGDLERILKDAEPRRGKLIVVDGVYSMGGDIAPLPEICDLRDRYGARLLVDDAHGNGVLGKGGGGVAEILGLEGRIDVHAGTFSKAFGTLGGFVAANRDVTDFIRFSAVTNLFTKAQPAVIVASTIKALELVREATDVRHRLWHNAWYLQTRLRKLGFHIGETMSPITPLIFSGSIALHVASELRDRYDIWVSPVLYPAVPLGTSIVRIIPTAMHTREQLDYLCNSLAEALARVQADPVLPRSTEPTDVLLPGGLPSPSASPARVHSGGVRA